MRTRTMFRQIHIWALSTALLLLFSFRHPYHVTVNTVKYDNKKKTISMEIKFFYHDLEPAVNVFTGKNIDIKNHANVQQRDSMVYAYVHDRFVVNIDQAKTAYRDVSIGFKDEYILIGLAMENVNGKNITFSNRMGYEVESTQTNLVHFIMGGKKQTKKAVNPAADVSFSL